MNRNRHWLFIFTFAVCMTVGPVQAQGNMPPPPTQGNNSAPDGDGPGHGRFAGNLTPEQRAQHRQKMMQRFDTNGDGVLDADEKARMHEFMQERRARRNGGGNGQQGSGGNPPGGGANQ